MGGFIRGLVHQLGFARLCSTGTPSACPRLALLWDFEKIGSLILHTEGMPFATSSSTSTAIRARKGDATPFKLSGHAGMIQFRCWYCNKHYSRPEGAVGERHTCSCGRQVRVPRKSFGNSRSKTALDWLIEATVYGGGGALLGLGLGALILVPLARVRLGGPGLVVLPTLTLLGFLIGLFGGERGINWIGRMIRGREE